MSNDDDSMCYGLIAAMVIILLLPMILGMIQGISFP